MIKSCNGKIEVSGPDFIVQADLASVINQFYRDGRFTKEQIQDVVDTAFMSDEELKDSVNKHLEEIGMTKDEAVASAMLASIFGDIL